MTEAATLRTIGGAIPKPDAWLKATGAAAYAGDVRLPGWGTSCARPPRMRASSSFRPQPLA